MAPQINLGLSAKEAGLGPDQTWVAITRAPDSLAAAAGVLDEDIITTMDGKAPAAWLHTGARMPPEGLRLEILRAGEPITILVPHPDAEPRTWQHAEFSEQWFAWETYCMLCGHTEFPSAMISGTYQKRVLEVESEWPPAGRSLFLPTRDNPWVKVIDGTGAYAAWHALLSTGPLQVMKLYSHFDEEARTPRYCLNVPTPFPSSEAYEEYLRSQPPEPEPEIADDVPDPTPSAFATPAREMASAYDPLPYGPTLRDAGLPPPAMPLSSPSRGWYARR